MCKGHYKAYKHFERSTDDPPTVPTTYTLEEINGCTIIAKGSRKKKCKVAHNGNQCSKQNVSGYDGMCKGHYKAFKHFERSTDDPPTIPTTYTLEDINGCTIIAKGSRKGKCKVAHNDNQCSKGSKGVGYDGMCREHHKAFVFFSKSTADHE